MFGGNSAISEGWGLYAERLAANRAGMTATPRGCLGTGHALFRAHRLVVARACMPSTGRASGDPLSQAASGLSTESSRSVSPTPGRRAATIGELKIVELRERAKASLGAASRSANSTRACSAPGACRSACSAGHRSLDCGEETLTGISDAYSFTYFLTAICRLQRRESCPGIGYPPSAELVPVWRDPGRE